ncbi:MAG TPA: hypothetical protein VFB58_06840 [Chloroflexota bacterium]|nr:hypothetical protein [Chloroflexota bacterium]
MDTGFNASNIQKGMDVYDSTGDKVGSISDVYPAVGSTGFGTTGQGAGDVVVEEVDIITETPDYSTADIGAPGTGYGTAGTTPGSDIGATGTTPGYGTPGTGTTPGYGGGISDTGTTGAAGIGSSGGFGTSPTSSGTMTGTGYFKVDQGGILGIGAKELYIPFSAVTSVDPGNCVTLNCTKDECDNAYSQKPAFLDQNT